MPTSLRRDGSCHEQLAGVGAGAAVRASVALVVFESGGTVVAGGDGCAAGAATFEGAAFKGTLGTRSRQRHFSVETTIFCRSHGLSIRLLVPLLTFAPRVPWIAPSRPTSL